MYTALYFSPSNEQGFLNFKLCDFFWLLNYFLTLTVQLFKVMS